MTRIESGSARSAKQLLTGLRKSSLRGHHPKLAVRAAETTGKTASGLPGSLLRPRSISQGTCRCRNVGHWWKWPASHRAREMQNTPAIGQVTSISEVIQVLI